MDTILIILKEVIFSFSFVEIILISNMSNMITIQPVLLTPFPQNSVMEYKGAL